MKIIPTRLAIALLSIAIFQQVASAQVSLIAKGLLTGSAAGANKDLSGLSYQMENGVSADLLGGIGSGLTYVTGNTFLMVPDRGPNAVTFNAPIDNTSSYINRFQTVEMRLRPNAGTGLPFTITPELTATTLLYSSSSLTYGSGDGLGVGSGVTPLNRPSRNYFTGRSDNFDPSTTSGDWRDARFDPEGIRVSNNGRFVFISDEYGPYVYQFLRATGQRIRSMRLPDSFYAATKFPAGNTEISGNSTGRTANKGMEGLAITPDGTTLVGIIQAPFIEDANASGPASKLIRIVTIDIESGETTHVYAYLLTTGSGVSEITALNDHEFLVDERDGKGLGDGSKAKVKQIFKIDLADAFDVSGLNGVDAAAHPVPKSLFLDVVTALNSAGIAAEQIPAKLEGISIGPDAELNGKTIHTLWIANDNDFLQDFSGPGTNPNQVFVFGFTDADLKGSTLVPQQVNSSLDR